MDIGRIAPATPPQKTNSFCSRLPGEVPEFEARDLDGFKLIRELRHTSEARYFVSGLKGGRLSGQRHVRSCPHLAKNGQHAPRLLLAVGAHNLSASGNHSTSAFGRGVAITAFTQ